MAILEGCGYLQFHIKTSQLLFFLSIRTMEWQGITPKRSKRIHLVGIRILLIFSHSKNLPGRDINKENMTTFLELIRDLQIHQPKLLCREEILHEREPNSNCITVVASPSYQTHRLDTHTLTPHLPFRNTNASNPWDSVFHVSHVFHSHRHYSSYILVSQLIYSKYLHIFIIYLSNKYGLSIH